MLLSLFPTPVGQYELDKELPSSLLDYILSVSKIPNTCNTRSECSYILDSACFLNLNKFFVECLDDYFCSIYRPKEDLKLRITQSWLNFSNKGESHHIHTHPNSFISGVFYIQTDADEDKILFVNPSDTSFEISPTQHTVFNSKTWWIPAKQNTLLLFPSSLSHTVPTVVSEQTRISLSFNTFFDGCLGDERRLTELIL